MVRVGCWLAGWVGPLQAGPMVQLRQRVWVVGEGEKGGCTAGPAAGRCARSRDGVLTFALKGEVTGTVASA